MNGQEHKEQGSFDHAELWDRMAAIDTALRPYFGAEDWIVARG